MKKTLIILIYGLFISNVSGQNKIDSTVITSSSSAPVKMVNIVIDTLTEIPAVQFLPKLEISDLKLTGLTRIEDENYIFAEERANLHFIIKNTGLGDAYNLRLFVSETTGFTGFNFINNKFIAKQFKSGEIYFDSINIEGRHNLQNGKANLELIANEANGNTSPAATISLTARESKLPNVEVISNNINRINKQEFLIQMTVKNSGYLDLKDVKIEILYPKTFYVKGDNIAILPVLKSDETADLNFTFVQNQLFNESVKDVFTVNIEDSGGRVLGNQREIVRAQGDATLLRKK